MSNPSSQEIKQKPKIGKATILGLLGAGASIATGVVLYNIIKTDGSPEPTAGATAPSSMKNILTITCPEAAEPAVDVYNGDPAYFIFPHCAVKKGGVETSAISVTLSQTPVNTVLSPTQFTISDGFSVPIGTADKGSSLIFYEKTPDVTDHQGTDVGITQVITRPTA